MIEPEHYSLAMAEKATGYTKEHLISLGAEKKIDFYVKNLKAWAIKIEGSPAIGMIIDLSIKYCDDCTP
ncbi:MAG: hypothetical protein PHH59_10940 [Methylovulum sp.]|uniref:hypothetical protein n=1 Tax=Methylovulum sp. TaxID=1916980 RepID=UPI0026372622|nr:hypothetical protein [Methylovulum sp.]MDD2724522.1 hypothetical protein [Methylovulum sp.]MDD5124047.1 hypothetical protein [Methylovulum sp.]